MAASALWGAEFCRKPSRVPLSHDSMFILTIKFCKITLEVMDLFEMLCFWMGSFKEVVEFTVLNATSTLVLRSCV